MTKVILPLLLLFSGVLPAHTQQSSQVTELPYKAQIGRWSDSITVDAIIQTGKVTCTNQAYQVIGFKFGFTSFPLQCYAEYNCTSDSLTKATIYNVSKLRPGYRIFLDSVLVRNETGKVYVLQPSEYRICTKLPVR
jgi:hypothetical protein